MARLHCAVSVSMWSTPICHMRHTHRSQCAQSDDRPPVRLGASSKGAGRSRGVRCGEHRCVSSLAVGVTMKVCFHVIIKKYNLRFGLSSFQPGPSRSVGLPCARWVRLQCVYGAAQSDARMVKCSHSPQVLPAAPAGLSSPAEAAAPRGSLSGDSAAASPPAAPSACKQGTSERASSVQSAPVGPEVQRSYSLVIRWREPVPNVVCRHRFRESLRQMPRQKIINTYAPSN